MIAEFAFRTPLGHREVREDTCGELGFRQLHGDRRNLRVFDCGAHHARASCEAYRFARESPDFSTYYNRLGPFAKLATSSIIVEGPHRVGDLAHRRLVGAVGERPRLTLEPRVVECLWLPKRAERGGGGESGGGPARTRETRCDEGGEGSQEIASLHGSSSLGVDAAAYRVSDIDPLVSADKIRCHA